MMGRLGMMGDGTTKEVLTTGFEDLTWRKGRKWMKEARGGVL